MTQSSRLCPQMAWLYVHFPATIATLGSERLNKSKVIMLFRHVQISQYQKHKYYLSSLPPECELGLCCESHRFKGPTILHTCICV